MAKDHVHLLVSVPPNITVSELVQRLTHGRAVSTSFYEYYLRAASLRQQTDEFKQLHRLRPRIEGKQAELVAHGLRNTRFGSKPKINLQHLWLAAAVNLKLFVLAG